MIEHLAHRISMRSVPATRRFPSPSDERVVRLNGTFLVAVTRRKNGAMRFETILDRENMLARVVSRYILDVSKVDCTMPIYLNLSERKDVHRLNVLSDNADLSDSELALVELAKCTMHTDKGIIVVKGFVSVVLTNTDRK